MPTAEIFDTHTTIVAPATAPGGAVMVVRLSGENAISIADRMFRARRPLAEAKGYTLHYGNIVNCHEEVIDDVVAALFRAPHSYTGDDTVEFTLHGSEYITSEVIRLAISYGATMALPGEFTRRAFLAGKMDLCRAEAVADIISSDSQWSHRVASTQMRGGYSAKFATLRAELLKLCSLLELELDFSEEDVEFADREQLRTMLTTIGRNIEELKSSFALGNILKNGLSVAIVGEPNVGKSTLLNRLVNDDCAMVSDIAGTTRDSIEATTIINGIRFRFIDTAGLRTTDDTLEQMGIERAKRAIANAHIVLHIASATKPDFEHIEISNSQHYIRVINKIDAVASTDSLDATLLHISAKSGLGIDKLFDTLSHAVVNENIATDAVLVSNMRHFTALNSAYDALRDAQQALANNLPADLVSEDLRRILHHLGEITGDITSDDILHTIFSTFCIGK